MKEWIRRMKKAFNKLVVRKKVFEDIYHHVERHQPKHPQLAKLKRQYALLLTDKDVETNKTDNAPSKEDTPKKRTSGSIDAGADCSDHQQQDEARTSAERNVGADCSAHEANNEPTTSGARGAAADCPTDQVHDDATEEMAEIGNKKDQGEGEGKATKEGCSPSHVQQATEQDIDPAEVEAALSVAEGAITQILASEHSAKIFEEQGKMMVTKERKEEEHSYDAPLPSLSIPPTFREELFWKYINFAEISRYVNVARIHMFVFDDKMLFQLCFSG